MTKKEIFTLLLMPALFLVIVIVASISATNWIQGLTTKDDHQQKFETFVSNVQSGKWQLTTDRWLEGMRQEDTTAEDYRATADSAIVMFRDFMWMACGIILFQTAMMFSILKKSKKAPKTAIQPTSTAP